MANIVLNDALGRIAEKVSDGADLIVVPLSAVVADATLKDAGWTNGNRLDAVLAEVGITEQTGSTWARKVHTNANITVTVDDTNDRVEVALDADDTWSSVAASNDVVALLICEDGAGDTTRWVLTKHDFSVTTDGNDVTADYNQADGFWQSS